MGSEFWRFHRDALRDADTILRDGCRQGQRERRGPRCDECAEPQRPASTNSRSVATPPIASGKGPAVMRGIQFRRRRCRMRRLNEGAGKDRACRSPLDRALPPVRACIYEIDERGLWGASGRCSRQQFLQAIVCFPVVPLHIGAEFNGLRSAEELKLQPRRRVRRRVIHGYPQDHLALVNVLEPLIDPLKFDMSRCHGIAGIEMIRSERHLLRIGVANLSDRDASQPSVLLERQQDRSI